MANYNDWNRSRNGSGQDWNNDDYRNQSDSERSGSGSSWQQDRNYYGSNFDSDRNRSFGSNYEGDSYRGDSDRFREDYNRGGNGGGYNSNWNNRGYQGSQGSEYYDRGSQGSNFNRENWGQDYNRGGGDYNRNRGYNRSNERGWWDKTKDEVSSWFGDDAAERRRRMDEREGPHRGKGPKGYTRSDDRIKEDVNDRLNDDSNLDASDIEVSVTGCEVTLSGTVKNRWEKRRAEDLAEAISGVKNVENRIKVNSDTYTGSTGQGTSRAFKTGDASGTGTSAYDTSKSRTQ